MTIEQVRAVYKASPFRPFTIHLDGRRSLRVTHPDFMAMSPAGRTVIVFEEISEEFHILDVERIREIQVATFVSSLE